MSVISMKQLLEAGVHFGHQTRKWNPKMSKYIFNSRNDIHIINLEDTVVLIDRAYDFIKDMASQGKSILFVGKHTSPCVSLKLLGNWQRCVFSAIVGDNKKSLTRATAQIHNYMLVVVKKKFKVSVDYCRFFTAHFCKLTVKGENRILAFKVGGKIDLLIFGVYLEPRSSLAESRILASVPLIGSTRVITAFGGKRFYRLFGRNTRRHHSLVVAHGIATVVVLDAVVFYVDHTDLLALIYTGSSGGGMYKSAEKLC